MTKREREFIEAKIKQYETWAKQERMEAKTSSDPEEREEHYRQEAINQASCDALRNVMIDLEEETRRILEGRKKA